MKIGNLNFNTDMNLNPMGRGGWQNAPTMTEPNCAKDEKSRGNNCLADVEYLKKTLIFLEPSVALFRPLTI